jgi:hypothetical protein
MHIKMVSICYIACSNPTHSKKDAYNLLMEDREPHCSQIYNTPKLDEFNLMLSRVITLILNQKDAKMQLWSIKAIIRYQVISNINVTYEMKSLKQSLSAPQCPKLQCLQFVRSHSFSCKLLFSLLLL